jgi:hypothetical protein
MGLPIIEITDRRTVHRGPVTSQRLRVISLDKLGERLLDANRTIGQPKKITVIFGRKITKHYRGATNRDRGHEPTQPGDPQPLRKRLYQAMRS